MKPTTKSHNIPLLGVPELDEQHVLLSRMIGELKRKYVHGATRQQCSRNLWRIVEYMQKHFRNEERSMLRFEYPGFDEHQAAHAALVAFAVAAAREFDAGALDVDETLVTRFQEWESTHIDSLDREFRDYARSIARTDTVTGSSLAEEVADPADPKP